MAESHKVAFKVLGKSWSCGRLKISPKRGKSYRHVHHGRPRRASVHLMANEKKGGKVRSFFQ